MLGRIICCIQSTDSNVDLIQKHPHEILRIMFCHIPGHNNMMISLKIIHSDIFTNHLVNMKQIYRYLLIIKVTFAYI